ncbi:MAG: hypothetical protein RL309_1638 [Verrucomicrobiota bacterium]
MRTSAGTVEAVALETTIIRMIDSGTAQMAGCSQRMRTRGFATQKSASDCTA